MASELDLSRLKEVKVKIPISYHIRLHSMKVLTGKQISDTITEALDKYFLEMKAGDGDGVALQHAVGELQNGIEEP